jgi:hypothetical protein
VFFQLPGLGLQDKQSGINRRFGQLVFQTKNWMVQWDGTVNGIMQPPGTYVWILSYTNHDTGQKFFEKGTTVLIR